MALNSKRGTSLDPTGQLVSRKTVDSRTMEPDISSPEYTLLACMPGGRQTSATADLLRQGSEVSPLCSRQCSQMQPRRLLGTYQRLWELPMSQLPDALTGPGWAGREPPAGGIADERWQCSKGVFDYQPGGLAGLSVRCLPRVALSSTRSHWS